MTALGVFQTSHFSAFEPHFGAYYAAHGTRRTMWPIPIGDLYMIDSNIARSFLRYASKTFLPPQIPPVYAQDDTIGAWMHFMLRGKVFYKSLDHGIDWLDILSLPYEMVEERCMASQNVASGNDERPVLVAHMGGPDG